MSESVSQGGALREPVLCGAGRESLTGGVVTTRGGGSNATVAANTPLSGSTGARAWCRTCSRMWCDGTGERSPSPCGSESGSRDGSTGTSLTGSVIDPSTGTTIVAGGAAGITGCAT